jgi:biopolymer transport protein TolR
MSMSLNGGSSSAGFSRRLRRRPSAMFADINVTPFVDVMLVLLVVFMVTAPLLTVGVPVDLPKTSAAVMNTQDDPLVITVDAQSKVYLQETEMELEALIGRLIAITHKNPEARIYVRGDQSLAYGRLLEVMGAISSAGLHKVSLIAEMPTPAPTKPTALKKPSAPVAPSSKKR